jgi:predicted AAA+ superfamily ATPase
LGAFFETLIYQHLRVLSGLLTPRGRLHFWRTQSGTEVDFVLEHGSQRSPGIRLHNCRAGEAPKQKAL